jgi:hypothetical protein
LFVTGNRENRAGTALVCATDRQKIVRIPEIEAMEKREFVWLAPKYYALAIVHHLINQGGPASESFALVPVMTSVWSTPSIGRSVGILPPTICAKVGRKSMIENIAYDDVSGLT